MDLLANENFPLDAVQALRKEGHNVAWIREDSRGVSDEEILSRALQENRIIITFDKDFGELAFRAKLPIASGIILLRISVPSATYIASTVVKALSSRNDWNGHFSVIEDNQIRMTPLPK